MTSKNIDIGDHNRLSRGLSLSIILAIISLEIYISAIFTLPYTWNTQYCCEQNSFSVAISNLIYGTPLGTIRRDVVDFLMAHRDLTLGQVLEDVRALPTRETNAPDQLLKTTFDGNGIGYPFVATTAFWLFGLHPWAPLLAMLVLMALATAAFLWRFSGAQAYIVTLYFVSLTALLFTAIVWNPSLRFQIPVAGIRYFSLVSVLPTLHILLHLFTQEAVEPRARWRDYGLLGVQAAVLIVAVMVRTSAASLFGAIGIAWLIQLWLSDGLRPSIYNAAVVCAVVTGLGVMLVLVMPKEYRSEGRVGTVVWHRIVASLGINPGFPFPGLNDMFADCRKFHPEGLRPNHMDANAGCIWIDYQIKHGLPIEGQRLFDAKYETVMEKQFFRIAFRYPGEVLSTFFYYKIWFLFRSMRVALQTNFASDVRLTTARDGKNFIPYPALAVGLLIAALAVGALHLAIASAAPNFAAITGVTLWAGLWTIPPYIVAWPRPNTIVDVSCYSLLLVALAFLGVATGIRWLRRRHRGRSNVLV